MDTRHFARIGAVAFVAIAITMTALQLREQPVRQVPEVVEVTDPDSDPLAVELRRCNALGEAAASDVLCHAAWIEKRRRFLGKEAGATPPAQPTSEPTTAPSPVPSGPAPIGDK